LKNASERVEEFERANGNALHLPSLIIPEKFRGLIVSICFQLVAELLLD